MPNKYTMTGVTDASYTGAANKLQLWAIKVGPTTPLAIDYISCHGSSDTADSLGLTLARYTGAHAGMTDFTAVLLEGSIGTGKPASAVSNTGAGLAVYDSTGQTDGTTLTSLYRWRVSTQSGGGLDIWFPEWTVVCASATFIGLFQESGQTVTACQLSFTVNWRELG